MTPRPGSSVPAGSPYLRARMTARSTRVGGGTRRNRGTRHPATAARPEAGVVVTYPTCPSCGSVLVWHGGQQICPSRTCPTRKETAVSILSARACAAIARRHVQRHPLGIGRADLLVLLVEAGAEETRAARGIALAEQHGWLTANGDTLTTTTETERTAA